MALGQWAKLSGRQHTWFPNSKQILILDIIILFPPGRLVHQECDACQRRLLRWLQRDDITLSPKSSRLPNSPKEHGKPSDHRAFDQRGVGKGEISPRPVAHRARLRIRGVAHHAGRHSNSESASPPMAPLRSASSRPRLSAFRDAQPVRESGQRCCSDKDPDLRRHQTDSNMRHRSSPRSAVVSHQSGLSTIRTRAISGVISAIPPHKAHRFESES